MPTKWHDTAAVADRYGVPAATVRYWRAKGTGPKGVRFGRHVRYSDEALSEWEAEQIRNAQQILEWLE